MTRNVFIILIALAGTAFAQTSTGNSAPGSLTPASDSSIVNQLPVNPAPILQKSPSPLFAENEMSVSDSVPVSGRVLKNAIAVIIGNKDYKYAPSVDYALNDATLMRKYVIDAMGYRPGNIKYLYLDATDGHN